MAGLIDENSCSAAKKLVLAYLGSIAASAHMAKVADAFETLKAGCTRRLERIAAPLEAMCEKEELCRRLGGIGASVGSPAVALDHEGLLPMPKFIKGYPPTDATYEPKLIELIYMVRSPPSPLLAPNPLRVPSHSDLSSMTYAGVPRARQPLCQSAALGA